MKLADSTPAPKPNRPTLYPIAVGFAAVITVITVALLFFLDKILEYVALHPVGGTGHLVLVLLTAVAGVFSLPYLLRIRVSQFMRLASCVAMFATVGGWMLGAWWVQLNMSTPYATGALIGSYVALLLAVMSVWVVGLELPPLKNRR